MNARWVDYCDFMAWLREDGLRRSVEAIRRHDPDKYIKFYAPHDHSDIMKALGEEYGCYFHDTGGMSGNWSDGLPSLARSSGLPFSLEPGNPAYDLPSLKGYFGIWLTEGLNAIDYFMDIGDILCGRIRRPGSRRASRWCISSANSTARARKSRSWRVCVPNG